MAKRRRDPPQRIYDEGRRIDWMLGRGIERSDFEARLASWAGVTPAQQLEDVVRLLYVAWSPAGQDIMHAMIDEARRSPGRRGVARAIRSARRIWRDVWREGAPSKGGAPPLWGGRQYDLWLMFQVALARARTQNPALSKAAMMKEFAERSRRGKGYWHSEHMVVGHDGSKIVPNGAVTLKSERQLKGLLDAVNKGPRAKGLHRMLKKLVEPTSPRPPSRRPKDTKPRA